MGDAVVPSEPPDWSSVLEQSLALLGRTRDLRVAVHLTNALLQRSGYAGFSEGLALVQEMLATFWATVHPELDREDGDDPTMRINALSALSTPPILSTLRSTPLVRARALGVVSLRDIQALSGEMPAPGSAPGVDSATLEAVFQEVEIEALETVAAAVKQSSEALVAIDTVFETHTGSPGPDLAPLSQILREASKALGPRLSARRAAAGGNGSEDQNDASLGHGEAADGRGGFLAGEVRCREDVVRVIDRICAYYARFEPTSPLPLLLERCKRLVTSSFVDIIRELAPDSLEQVERLGGRKPE
jgi:type VI secretion system protein ImpA